MKMASANNKSGRKARSGNLEGLVDNSCKHVIKEILKEINENMAVLYAELSRLGKDMELMQKTMEILCTDEVSPGQKVENIDVNIETTTVGVLKKVFGFGDGSIPHAEGVADAVVRDLEPGVVGVEELVTNTEQASGEIDPSSSG